MALLKERKKASPVALLARALVLLLALGGVFLLIVMIQGPGFRAALEGMFNAGNRWTWCPPETSSLKPMTGEVVTDPGEISANCRILIESVTTDELNASVLKPLLTAENAKGTSVTLEGDLEKGVFRAGGLPFRSPGLQKRLQSNSQP